jgi:hypothetical protein
MTRDGDRDQETLPWPLELYGSRTIRAEWLPPVPAMRTK